MTLLKENINAHHPECLKMYLLIIMCRFLNYSNSFSFWNCWTINSHRHGERIVLGITSYYLKASSLCNEDCAPYLVSPQYEWGMMKAPCLWDAVYIIRGSYLTYLGPCIRPEISDCVCVCVNHGPENPRSSLSMCVTQRWLHPGPSPQVFLREAERQRLQALLHGEVLRRIVTLQRRFRARLERQQFVRMREAAICIQVRYRAFHYHSPLSPTTSYLSFVSEFDMREEPCDHWT